MARLGSWKSACAQAGVQPGESARKTYASSWTDAQLLSWVDMYLHSTDHATFTSFDAWLRTQDGAPSAGTVRNRLGTWRQMTTRAIEERRAAEDFGLPDMAVG